MLDCFAALAMTSRGYRSNEIAKNMVKVKEVNRLKKQKIMVLPKNENKGSNKINALILVINNF